MKYSVLLKIVGALTITVGASIGMAFLFNARDINDVWMEKVDAAKARLLFKEEYSRSIIWEVCKYLKGPWNSASKEDRLTVVNFMDWLIESIDENGQVHNPINIDDYLVTLQNGV